MKISVLALALFWCGSSWAQGEVEEGRVKATMHTFLIEMAKITPYLGSQQAFTSEKGKAAVGSAIEAMAARTRKPPEKLKESAGFRITFGLLADHMQKTKAVFDKGEMEYARLRLNGTANLCASCHTQTPVGKKNSLFPPVDDLTAKVSFDNASFLFVIRRYEQALAQFDTLIRGYPTSGVESDQLGEVFRRKIAVFARVFRDPKGAIESLQADLKNQNLPSDIRANVKSWIAGFEKLKSDKTNPEKLSTPKLIEYVSTRLPNELNRKIPTGDPQLLNLLYLSGLLYERLFKEPNGPDTQQLLYYLAVFERSLAPVVWYSVSEIYLKECVVAFQPTTSSKRCLDAYESGMRERFFGKSIPEPIQNSIDAMKEYLVK